MFRSLGRRVGFVLLVAVILGALAAPAASASTSASSGERVSGAQLNATNAGGWGCSQYYVVRRGDNLTRIAYRYGTTLNALMQCNNIWDPDLIYAGQRLCICHPYRPQPHPKPQPPPCPQPCPRPCPSPQTGYWSAQYWNNRDLAGSPVLTRWDPVLNFNWGWGSPAWEVPPDNFSAQWTRTFYMQGGTWRVTTTADDGVRVYVDGVPVIDEWKVSAATTHIRDIGLGTGYHTVIVQYFEAEGVAQVALTIKLR
jgi:LysM repeat protein